MLDENNILLNNLETAPSEQQALVKNCRDGQNMEVKSSQLDMTANTEFVCLFIATVNIPGVLLGFAMSY